MNNYTTKKFNFSNIFLETNTLSLILQFINCRQIVNTLILVNSSIYKFINNHPSFIKKLIIQQTNLKNSLEYFNKLNNKYNNNKNDIKISKSLFYLKKTYQKKDILNFGNDQNIIKLLNKVGNNLPQMERIIYSNEVQKINKRGKYLKRKHAIFITNKGLYELRFKVDYQMRKRVDLENIILVAFVYDSNELGICRTDEYDLRYVINDLDDVIYYLSQAYLDYTGKELEVKEYKPYKPEKIEGNKTEDVILLGRQERLERLLKLYQNVKFDDELNDVRNCQNIKKLFEFKENVTLNDFIWFQTTRVGRYGKVISTYKKNCNETYALKILKKKSLMAIDKVFHTSLEELKYIRKRFYLRHPFMKDPKYGYETETRMYLLYINVDYYDRLLFHLRNLKKFTELQAKYIIAQIIMAIGYIHSVDAICYQLNIENILIDKFGYIKLLYYGIESNKIKNFGNYFDNTLTPEYWAPEIVNNLGHNKSIDWWSLGILLYELVIGYTPFYNEKLNELCKSIKESKLIFPNNVILSKEFKDLVSKLLERDPKKRIGNSERDFEQVLEHEFFKGLDTNLLYQKQVSVPYRPSTTKQN